jgi:hypothetical protein
MKDSPPFSDLTKNQLLVRASFGIIGRRRDFQLQTAAGFPAVITGGSGCRLSGAAWRRGRGGASGAIPGAIRLRGNKGDGLGLKAGGRACILVGRFDSVTELPG